jgi:hypothetical protein
MWNEWNRERQRRGLAGGSVAEWNRERQRRGIISPKILYLGIL